MRPKLDSELGDHGSGYVCTRSSDCLLAKCRGNLLPSQSAPGARQSTVIILFFKSSAQSALSRQGQYFPLPSQTLWRFTVDLPIRARCSRPQETVPFCQRFTSVFRCPIPQSGLRAARRFPICSQECPTATCWFPVQMSHSFSILMAIGNLRSPTVRVLENASRQPRQPGAGASTSIDTQPRSGRSQTAYGALPLPRCGTP